MSDSLKFTWRVNGVLTPATSVVLANAAGTYGVKRTDTNAVVAPAHTTGTPAPMVLGTDNVYRYALPSGLEGVPLTWSAKVVYNGVPSYFEFDHVGAEDGLPPVALPGRGGRWRVTVAPTSRPVTPADFRQHCRLDTAEASGVSDAQVCRFIDAATEFAEARVATSLVPRTLAATFYDGETIDLPRGPVISVVSIADADGNPTAAFDVRNVGHATRVLPRRGIRMPCVVTYRAGYAAADGTTPVLPADLTLAILMHAATLYENRESVSEKTMTPVPHSLEAFYARKCRELGIG